MSDSVTSVDVEDVLSSIRRLVTDTNSDARSAPATTEEKEEGAVENKASDALLLTSALRVPAKSDETDGEESAEAETASETAKLANLREAIGQSDEQASEALDWPAADADDYYEDDEPEDVAPVIDFIRHDRFSEADVPEYAADEDSADTTDDPTDDPTDEAATPSDDEARDEDEHRAEDDESHDDDVPDWVPEFVHEPREGEAIDARLEEASDSDEDVDALPEWLEHGHAEISEAELVEDTHESGDQEHDDDPDEPSDWDAAFDDEDEVGVIPELDDASEPEVIFASAAAASVFTTDRQAEEADISDSGLGNFADDVIDEDALRDLVAEIVREELTGELGERITRNVRKLVRREIHRAMLTREFE